MVCGALICCVIAPEPSGLLGTKLVTLIVLAIEAPWFTAAMAVWTNDAIASAWPASGCAGGTGGAAGAGAAALPELELELELALELDAVEVDAGARSLFSSLFLESLLAAVLATLLEVCSCATSFFSCCCCLFSSATALASSFLVAFGNSIVAIKL